MMMVEYFFVGKIPQEELHFLLLTSVGKPSSSSANANEYVPVRPYPTPTTLRLFAEDDKDDESLSSPFSSQSLVPLTTDVKTTHPLYRVLSTQLLTNHTGWPIPMAIPE